MAVQLELTKELYSAELLVFYLAAKLEIHLAEYWAAMLDYEKVDL